ncbi:UNVERIFIED_CONTAM: hypothetical protein GTU68_040299 [Idotea baltica]|nr:hypothetical protein [Idotea baltica]
MIGKKIVLGVCGSIAAYKAALLVRLLVKSGAEVKVIMTQSAKAFITPLTLSTLSKNEVLFNFESSETGLWNNHVDLSLWADLFLIAPTSANTIAKFANGICDNLLSAVYLSARCPVVVAPAMDYDMWLHPSTQRNITQLKTDGVTIIAPESGELASGLVGEGRLAEPENIVKQLNQLLQIQQPLAGKKVMITAGPTYEPIDPVRFIGNHSSGKMGIALADYAASLGAEVQLILGPSRLLPKNETVKIEHVTSAHGMLRASLHFAQKADWCIMAAAVSDYTPEQYSETKIKKSEKEFTVDMRKTTDILAELGKTKRDEQMLIGFALETNNEVEHAKKKLVKKNLDFIVLNSLQDKGAGFGYDTNKVTIINRSGELTPYKLKSKWDVAGDILQYAKAYEAKRAI